MTNDQWLYLDMRVEVAILYEKQKQLSLLIASKEAEAAKFSDCLSAKEMIEVGNVIRAGLVTPNVPMKGRD